MPTPSPHYRIGEAAGQAGVSAANIRYYEKEGLLAPQARQDNSYRLYSDRDIHQLRFIRMCRAMDMSLGEVRTLLGLDMRKESDCASDILDEHIGHVRQRLTELKGLLADLNELRSRCDGKGGNCRIIEALHERADRLPATSPRARAHRHV